MNGTAVKTRFQQYQSVWCISDIGNGPTTVDELARKLKVSKEKVEDALRLMIEMGIIEEVVPQGCSAHRKGITCSFCPLKDNCGISEFEEL